MSEKLQSSQTTTSNGYEIEHPREKMKAAEFRSLVAEYGLTGENPKSRADQLKAMPKEQVAMLMTDINRRAQGSEQTLVSEKVMKIGKHETIAPENRYDLFTHLLETVQASDNSINPERVGDALALGTVILHPFADGNGRTARLLGLMLRDDFDAPDYESTFDVLAEPRDDARERGGFMIYGYIPHIGEGLDQGDPTVVAEYFDKILTSEAENLYTGPYGQAQLQTPTSTAA